MNKQPLVRRCVCGLYAPVALTASPAEFEWACACGLSGTISWTALDDPPVVTVSQPTLPVPAPGAFIGEPSRPIFRCGCGFQANEAKQMIAHQRTSHRP